MQASTESSIVMLCSDPPGPFISNSSFCFICSILGGPGLFLLFPCHSRMQKFLEAKCNLIRLTVFPLRSCYFFNALHKEQNSSLITPETCTYYLTSPPSSQLRQELLCLMISPKYFAHRWSHFQPPKCTGFRITKTKRRDSQIFSFSLC